MGRKWGQHFLKSVGIARKIVDALQLWNKEYTCLLEIGPGRGILTQFLVDAQCFAAIEIDPVLVGYLQRRFPGLRVIHGDALQIAWDELFNDRPFGIVGNLDYRITAPVFRRVIAYYPRVVEAVLMIQREVANRLAGEPGRNPRAIPLTILLHNWFTVQKVGDVSPRAFRPPPQVWGSVLRLVRRPQPVLPYSLELLEGMLRRLFQYRRKKIKTSVRQIWKRIVPEDVEWRDARPEELSFAAWQEFFDWFTGSYPDNPRYKTQEQAEL